MNYTAEDLRRVMAEMYRLAGRYVSAESNCMLLGVDVEVLPLEVNPWVGTIYDELLSRILYLENREELPPFKPISVTTPEEAEENIKKLVEELLKKESEIEAKEEELEIYSAFHGDVSPHHSFKSEIEKSFSELFHEITDSIIEERCQQLIAEGWTDSGPGCHPYRASMDIFGVGDELGLKKQWIKRDREV